MNGGEGVAWISTSPQGVPFLTISGIKRGGRRREGSRLLSLEAAAAAWSPLSEADGAEARRTRAGGEENRAEGGGGGLLEAPYVVFCER
jgi:hypothetical protein